jgi:deoxycytidylate deaminase
MRRIKETWMMANAALVSQLSTCRRLRVGCVLTDPDFEQMAVGYNGAYRGGPNDCLHPDVGEGCGCIHAEINACIKAKFKPYMAFVTTSPCEKCAAALVNTGVMDVMIGRAHSSDAGILLLKEAGVGVTMCSSEELTLLKNDFGLDVYLEPYLWG